MSSGAVGKAIANIKVSPLKGLTYITNPEKTENKLLVSGVNCYNPENPVETANEFKEVQDMYLKKNASIVAHHYLISFAPEDKISPQKAHELSEEVVDRFLKKQHQAVLSTHVDKKEHIHTHIIFNAFNKNNGEKYESSPAKLREFKKAIDEVCLEHNLQLINKKKHKENLINLDYKDWLKKRKGNDKKLERFEYIRQAVKSILKDGRIKDLDQFSRELEQRYGIKSKYKNNKTNVLHKNISFRCDDWEQSIRGKYDISLDNIKNQLEGREVANNKYEEFCINNNTNDYRKYIKNAIDTLLNDNEANSIDNLAELLKSRYNIEMKYLASNGTYLNRFKFKALDSKQRNFIGAASLDKENRSNYELEGLKKKISSDINFRDDIRENLKILNKNLISSEKEDRWGINITIDYMTKNKLRTRNDINIRRSNINLLKQENELYIKDLNEYVSNMNLTYDRLKKKIIELKATKKELEGLGLLKIKQKKELYTQIEKLDEEINKLKESKYYQKEMKYSEKLEELTSNIERHREDLKENNMDLDFLLKIELIDTEKEQILKQIQADREQEKELNKDKELDL